MVMVDNNKVTAEGEASTIFAEIGVLIQSVSREIDVEFETFLYMLLSAYREFTGEEGCTDRTS